MNGLKIRIIVTLFSSLFMLPPTIAMAQDIRIDIAVLSETSNYEKLNDYLVDKGFKKLSRLNNSDPNDSTAKYEEGAFRRVIVDYAPLSHIVSSVSYRWAYLTNVKDEFSESVTEENLVKSDKYIGMCREYYLNVLNRIRNDYGVPTSIKVYKQPDTNGLRYIKDKSVIDTLKIDKLVNSDSSFDVFWINSERYVSLTYISYGKYSESLIDFTYFNNKNAKIRSEEIVSMRNKELLSKIGWWTLGIILASVLVYIIVREYRKNAQIEEELAEIRQREEEERLESIRREEEEKKKQRRLQYEVIKTEHKNYVSKLVEKYGNCDKTIRLNTNNPNEIFEIMAFSQSQHVVIGNKEFVFSDIIDCTVNDNIKERETVQTYRGNSVATSKADTGSMVGRAIVGGVLLGGAGAVIGGSTAKRNTVIEHGTDTSIHNKVVEHDYTVAITVKDIANPIIYLNVGSNAKLKDEIVSLMKVIMSMK